jgi:pimeloyl-ACP methyl ester carboxylesterase
MWHLLPTMTRRIITKHAFSPKCYPLTPEERQYLKTGEAFQMHVHDKQIRCWKWGRGPGILFVHGWNGRGIHFRPFFEAFLNAGYSVITYDAPAHGESDGQDTSYFEMTDTLRSLLDPSRGLNIQGIVAHSMGASAVVNGLSKEKSSIDAVLIAPALKLRELIYNTFDNQGMPEVVYQTMIAEYEEYYGYNMYADNPYKLLKEISSKIFIVHDKGDPTTPYMDSKSIAEKLGHIDLLATEGLGHKRILGDKTVVKTVQEYIFDRRINGSNLQQATH